MRDLLLIASLSFLVALSGALAPGPLLTYTIVRTMQSRRRGLFVGAWVILGHALLESALIMALLLGLSGLLRSVAAVRAIGAAGGLFLLYTGLRLLVDVVSGRVAVGPADAPQTVRPSSPVLGGVLVSMSNPYWWIWWASVGFAFMVQYRITLINWKGLLAFFVGHEAGDLAWYLTVSVLVFLGRRRISGGVYRVVLAACALVILGFGVYLGISSFRYEIA